MRSSEKALNTAKIIILLIGFLTTSTPLHAQVVTSITAKYITDKIKLDGIADEPIWEQAKQITNFWLHFPIDSVQTKYKTWVKIVYSDNMLYVALKVNTQDKKHVVTSLKRDFSGMNNDNVTLIFDTYSDGNNGFAFGITPYGVQRELLVSQGGNVREGFNGNWDVKWQAESKIYDSFYTVEMAIPFTSIKFRDGATKWRMQIIRWDLKHNEQSAWIRVPQTQLFASLNFMGELRFEKPLGKSKTPLYWIPYVNTINSKDYVNNLAKSQVKVGLDAKIAVGNSMNLDLTLNPDFSNTEVDDIVNNLTRFELRLPEKRQFFIDNNDLFDNFGNFFNEAKPFFSRRIGLAKDTLGNLIQNQIIGGARLSGKLDNNWRLGFLNIQSKEDAANRIGSYNNMMFALQRKIGARSNLGLFWVNKQTFGKEGFLKDADLFNRVIGADLNLISKSNKWNSRMYMHHSFQPNDASGNVSAQATVTYNTRKFVYTTDISYVNKDFRADLGFVPRVDVIKSGNLFTRYFYPKRGPISSHGARLLSIFYWKPTLNFKKTDHAFTASWIMAFRSLATLQFDASNNYIYLTSPFDPTGRANAQPLPGNTAYTFNTIGANYQSNNAKLFTYTIGANVGTFFNGNKFSANAVLGYRIQPRALFSVALNYDGLRLPQPYNSANFWLISPRAEITFSKSLFWSTLIQYSSRSNNLGVNSRLQWRFAPLSDLYLVYNDSYLVQDFGPRFRSVNLKVSYWFNK